MGHTLRRTTIVVVSLFLALNGPFSALAATPNDPDFPFQTYLQNINAEAAWDFAKGSPTVTVAVIDGGIDLSHPDLRDRIFVNSGEIPGNGIDDDGNGYVDDTHGWDFVNDDNDPNPDISPGSQKDAAHHGTVVAGVIGAAGNNAMGTSGVNWNVRILPLRVLDDSGLGGTNDVVSAVEYAVAAGARIINVSFTGTSFSPTLAAAVYDAYQRGVLVVASAGNEGDTERGGNLNDFPMYPACFRGPNGERTVLTVAAVDDDGRKSSFSSYGSNCVGISAPGENFHSTQVFRPPLPGFREPYGGGWSGSSLSSPVVSGAAALIASMDPTIGADGIRSFLRGSARNIDALNPEYTGHLGAGLIDAGAAVLAVQTSLLGGSAPPPAPSEPDASAGRLIKLPDFPAVYYLGNDSKRYVFPNEKTFRSWYPVDAPVRVVTPGEMASYPLGGNVTYRPGIRMIKIQTDPRIYAVSRNGTLRHVASETAAGALYGPDWNANVDDISEAFFVDYRLGAPIFSALDYDPAAEAAAVPSIDHDKNLLSGGQ